MFAGSLRKAKNIVCWKSDQPHSQDDVWCKVVWNLNLHVRRMVK